MKFDFSIELKEKIKIIFEDYNEFENKLLSGDTDAIHQVGCMSQKNIDPQEIIDAYESNNVNYLYNKAKKMIAMKEIYKELCDEYALNISEKYDKNAR